jgi:hypothetical protein
MVTVKTLKGATVYQTLVGSGVRRFDLEHFRRAMVSGMFVVDVRNQVEGKSERLRWISVESASYLGR